MNNMIDNVWPEGLGGHILMVLTAPVWVPLMLPLAIISLIQSLASPRSTTTASERIAARRAAGTIKEETRGDRIRARADQLRARRRPRPVKDFFGTIGEE